MIKKIASIILNFFKRTNDNEKGAMEFIFLILIFVIMAIVIAIGVIMSSYFKGV